MSQATTIRQSDPGPAAPPKPTGYYRWTICALLFFAATINYVDRQVLSILKPDLQEELKWSESQYSNIVLSFQAAYAIGLLVVGRLMDWLGTRKGFSIAIAVWSIAAMAHAGMRSVAGFMAARFALGIGESASFPVSIKTVAEWFPKKERALATGIFNAGTNVGAVVTPIAVPILVKLWGWPSAFIFTGALGFIWVVFWLLLYHRPESHPRLSASELAYIQTDPPDPPARLPWAKILPHRQAWAFAIGKFMTDPIWWFFLFWLPDFLKKEHGLNLVARGLPLFIIYLLADVGSIGGGWLSSSLVKRGWGLNRARKTAMLVCALSVVPILFALKASNLWVAVVLIGLATAAHQGWSCNLFTLVSDTFPRQAVGSVVGFGGMFGAIGGMLIAKLVGYVLDKTGSYTIPFVMAASAYLLALLVIHLLVPRLEPVVLESAEKRK